ncbi:class I SAM-dependent methyltransferase [Desulfobacula phenolica]|uniref:UbiE/COQ5 methyltransferase family protein n=1 Tax=Desulfobacula phenolica TaxID=90732 RepID=A0A1H2JBI5_9BACT|nr:class I SAM-dependent methyltransferase [Desulfobacula phenolica]SDU53525.1 ubiE/COQ5 methyltransferase family protein [Desulfobacula phenolica]
MNNAHKKPKGAGKSSFELINQNILTDILPVKPGSVVLDLACGKGIYSIFLSDIAGDQGLIYAVDLWKEGLELLEEQIETRNITNIKTLLLDATEQLDIDDYSVDICLMATVLHDFEEIKKAGAVLNQINTILKPGGCLAIVEFKKIEAPPGPPIKIRLSEDDVEKMVTGYGFKKDKTADIGDYNYLMTFRSR